VNPSCFAICAGWWWWWCNVVGDVFLASVVQVTSKL